MSYVIRRLPEADYLRAYDPHWQVDPGHPQYPSGLVEWTVNWAAAMRFDSPVDAHQLWITQSTTYPYRPDGKPNRPLTAHTIEIVRDDQ